MSNGSGFMLGLVAGSFLGLIVTAYSFISSDRKEAMSLRVEAVKVGVAHWETNDAGDVKFVWSRVPRISGENQAILNALVQP